MAQIEEGLRKFEELEKARGVSYKDDPRRVTLLRIKIRDTATLAHSKEEAKQLRNLIESASGKPPEPVLQLDYHVLLKHSKPLLLFCSYSSSSSFQVLLKI